MNGDAAGKVQNLHTTRETGSDDGRVGAGGAQRREQALLADEPRHFVMLLLVAEGPCHATATRIELDDVADRLQRAEQGRNADKCPLVTMRLHQDTWSACGGRWAFAGD